MNHGKPMSTLQGVITAYEGNGRKLGYPTANINAKTDLQDGVYFGYASLKEFIDHPALIFIGQPVTVGSHIHRVEAHLLDIPDQDYYSEKISLKIFHFHRANQKFDSIEQLIKVMENDEVAARAWFSNQG